MFLFRILLSLAWFSTAVVGLVHIVEQKPLSVFEMVALGTAAFFGFVHRAIDFVEEVW